MKKIVLDLETDDLDYKKCWVVATHDLVSNTKNLFKRPDLNKYERNRLAQELEEANEVIMHNGLGFDWFVLKDLMDIEIPIERVFDTLVAGRLLALSVVKDHRLETIGEFFKFPKPIIDDFTQGLTTEMVERVQSDVEITKRWYQYLCNIIHNRGGIYTWLPALRLEFEVQPILDRYNADGFYFNRGEAISIRDNLTDRLSELENTFQELWPPALQIVETKAYRKKQDGEEYNYVVKARDTYPKVEVDGDLLHCYDYVSFNPASPRDRIDKLWEAGWKPVIKTDKHYQWDRLSRRIKETPKEQERGERFKVYGWKCNEENLLTLPDDAPDGAHRLAEYLTLQGRLADLNEWLDCLQEDSRIHGRMVHIGGWTQRLAHYSPNLANIFAPFHGEANSPVKQIKKEYDERLRALWCVPTGKYQVGTDAEGIQLRLLAHFMKSELYRDAILKGSKHDETDIHNVNKRALGLSYVTRDMAKTFIYAFLLGAGVGRVQQILECMQHEARQAMDSFYSSIPGLHELKNIEIPSIWSRGYFEGLDGRRVKPPSQHKVLAGMLQNGEALVMKKALTLWHRDTIYIEHKLLTFPHDEWQTEVNSLEDGHKVGSLQVNAIEAAGEHFNLFCPLAGEYRLGTNWSETH